MNYRSSLIALAGLLFSIYCFSQELPLGYIKHYSNSFTSKKIGEDLCNSSNIALQVQGQKSDYWLQANITSRDSLLFPSSMIVLSDQIYGEYIMNVKLRYDDQTSDSTNGIYFIGSMRDSLNYYSVCLNSHESKFYRIYNGERSLLAVQGNLLLSSVSGTRFGLLVIYSTERLSYKVERKS